MNKKYSKDIGLLFCLIKSKDKKYYKILWTLYKYIYGIDKMKKLKKEIDSIINKNRKIVINVKDDVIIIYSLILIVAAGIRLYSEGKFKKADKLIKQSLKELEEKFGKKVKKYENIISLLLEKEIKNIIFEIENPIKR